MGVAGCRLNPRRHCSVAGKSCLILSLDPALGLVLREPVYLPTLRLQKKLFPPHPTQMFGLRPGSAVLKLPLPVLAAGVSTHSPGPATPVGRSARVPTALGDGSDDLRGSPPPGSQSRDLVKPTSGEACGRGV